MTNEEMTYDGGNAYAMLLWVREHIQPSPFQYMWGGMEWRVTWYQERVNYGDKLVWDGQTMRLVKAGGDA